MKSAARNIEAGEFALAISSILQIVESPNDSFDGDNSATAMPARDRALRLTLRLPEESRARLAVELDRIAHNAWGPIKQNGSSDEILQFAYRYRSTLSGLEALQMLAANHRDCARHEFAAIVFEKIVEHPRATRIQRSYAVIGQISSQLTIGRLAEAQQVSILNASLLDTDSALLIAGRSVKPWQWVTEKLKAAGLSSSASSAKVGINATTNTISKFPGLKPTWTKETGAVKQIQDAIPAIEQYFREQGVVSLCAARPIVVGNVVLTRSMKEVLAFEITTGEQLRNWPIPNKEYGWIGNVPNALDNNLHRSKLIGDWHRRIEADSLFHSLSSDGRLVVVVQEPDRSKVELGPPRPEVQQPAVSALQWNRLFGYEVATGELRWQIGGPLSGPANIFGGTYFLGTPLFVDDTLFEIARRGEEILLLALDRATGHVRWSLVLGGMPVHLADSLARRRIACPVTMQDGLLICPTATGSLIAVDPITRTISWAYRYPVLLHDAQVRPPNGPVMPPLPDHWWNEWREVQCLMQTVPRSGETSEAARQCSSITILASPDSNALHAINTEDGTLLWTVPRSGALMIAGLFDGQVIVVEPVAVRSHDLQTGAIRWRAETGDVSGRGAIAGQHLIQPRRAGGFAVIDLKNGSQTSLITDSEFVAGSLIPFEGGWVTQTEQSLMRLPFLDQLRQQALTQWQANDDEANSLALARLDLQSGDAVAARHRLASIDSIQSKELRRKAITEMLRSPRNPDTATVDSGIRRGELGRELLALCESDEDRLLALRTLGESAWADNDSVQAISYFVDGLELIDTIGLRSLGDWSPSETSNRIVRPDRILLGAIEQILEAAARAEPRSDGSRNRLAELDATLNARLAAARRSSDPFALQRLMDKLIPLEWGRRALAADPSPALYARPLAKTEPLLMLAAGSRDREASTRAANHLAQLFIRSGWRSEAEAIERRLVIEESGSANVNNQTPADPSRVEARQRGIAPIPDPWPDVFPTSEVIKKVPPNLKVHFVPLKIQAKPGSLLDRLDVSVDRAGRRVRFAGEGHAEPWEIELPNQPGQLRPHFANFNLIEAYGVGRLLVLRLGSEVFGIRPLNDHGEPSDRKKSLTDLQFDLAPSHDSRESTWSHEMVPGKPGIRPPGVRTVDGFGHTLGGLGPVRPGYVCYRSQARLVAVETQTGRRLWERLDLPPHCQAFGDDERVYLWRTEERSLQVLSAVDGRVIEERPWKVSPDDVLMQQGSRTWIAVRQPAPGIELVDARDGGTLWSRIFPPNSVPFLMDNDTLGVVDPAGLLHLVSAYSGASLAEPLSIEVPEKIEQIVCVHDAQRWYFAVSGPVPRHSILQAEQVWGGWHLAFINGWLYGIERLTPKVCWKRLLDAEPIPLEISKNTPVLAQAWSKSIGDSQSGQNRIGVLRLVDKRTGREIVTLEDPALQPYFSLRPIENGEILEVSTERERIRLNYKKPEKPDQEQPQTEKN